MKPLNVTIFNCVFHLKVHFLMKMNIEESFLSDREISKKKKKKLADELYDSKNIERTAKTLHTS